MIVLTHAPFQEITRRIIDRQHAGMKDERFWGFNSPFFLERYQARWLEIAQSIAQAGLYCVAIDTAQHTPTETLSIYETLRDKC